MTENNENGPAKDVPPWLQPVPEAEEEQSFFAANRNTLIAAGGAILVIAVFVAAIVFLYDEAPKGGPRHIAADAAPVREKPADPGGMDVPNQDKAVLEIGDGMPATSRVEIGEQPEQPVTDIPDEQPAVETEEKAPAQTNTIGDLAAAVLREEEQSRAADPAPAQTTEAAPSGASQQASATQEPQAGEFRVQLGAYGSEQSARAAWRTLRGRFASQLGGLEATYVPVQSGDRTLYRLRVGMLASRAAADAVCISLRAQQQACFVVNP